MAQPIPAPLETNSAPRGRTRRSAKTPITLPETGDGLIDDNVAAAALAIGRSTFWRLVSRLVADGRLHPVKIGSATRFKISEIRALAQ